MRHARVVFAKRLSRIRVQEILNGPEENVRDRFIASLDDFQKGGIVSDCSGQQRVER